MNRKNQFALSIIIACTLAASSHQGTFADDLDDPDEGRRRKHGRGNGEQAVIRLPSYDQAAKDTEAYARASRVLARVTPSLATGDVALVAHGHLLRILTATWLRQPPRFGASLLLDAGALCVLEVERAVPAIRTWNQTPP